eukprot:CAMPEP_0179006144 /NCGR_PEP_ID=MMETSP0795-20121207/14371_1 /TAXON_ID=88552 /ORGANISM="Amoebophrya sp., Strain Ameob2" /LENGTH=242 /DNA_ID=CAMNT_0020700833 /DNA_START=58 /DNA_END=786 /DNA_ORIENTATION=-
MAAAPLTEREQKVYLAKLCEQAERYDEMGNYMREVGEMEEELNAEERNLLSVAYKNAVGYRRAAWRVVNSLEQKERSRGNFDNAAAAEGYKKKIEGELAKICDEILKLIRMSLLAKASTGEDKVFYLKMKGDYYRYKAEFEPNEQNLKNQAQGAYAEAMSLAQAELVTTSPIRLGLALNFSVFYYEVLNRSDEACKLARQAFEDAIAELDSVAEDVYKDATLIMQLLRDNLTLWTSDESGAL